MRFLTTTLVFAICLAVAFPASADMIRLKNGAEIEGTFLGGDTRTVRFLGPDGSPASYSINDVATIEFGSAPVAAPAPAAAPAPGAAPAPAATAASGVVVPSGTVVTVRMIDSIDVRQTAIGERFRASIDDPVVVDGRTVLPRGADCTVQVMRAETAGRVSGSDELALKLYDVTLNGKPYEVTTAYAELKTRSEGRNTARNTGIMAGVGAAIGAVAGGGTGAAIGAAAGGGAGLGASMIKGPHLQVPSETRLSFELRAPLPLN